MKYERPAIERRVPVTGPVIAAPIIAGPAAVSP
jgi:hypothetical protein